MKFDLTYVDKDGSKKTPVVLHRAVFGSIDRFIAYYLEEKKGVLPLFLSPVQCNIVPVNNEYHLRYAKEINDLLIDNDIRSELDDRDEKMNYKIRESVTKKIPITIILGDKEKDNEQVSFRRYGSEETITVSKEDFVTLVKNEINNKK